MDSQSSDDDQVKLHFHRGWDILTLESNESRLEEGLICLANSSGLLREMRGDNAAFIKFCVDELAHESYIKLLIVIVKLLNQLKAFRETSNVVNNLIAVLKGKRRYSDPVADTSQEYDRLRAGLCSLFRVSHEEYAHEFSDSEKDEVKGYYKLILRTIETSNTMMLVSIEDKANLERLVYHVCRLQLWPSAVRFAVAFAAQWNVETLLNLLSRMKDLQIPAADYRELLIKLDKAYLSIMAQTLYVLGLTLPHSVYSEQHDDPLNDKPSLSMDETDALAIRVVVRKEVLQFVRDNKESSAKSVLTALVDLLTHFIAPPSTSSPVALLDDDVEVARNALLVAEASHNLKSCKIRLLVTSNKWHLAAQVANSLKLKLDMYRYMLAEQLFIQAAEKYREWNLQGRVMPVTDDQIAAQKAAIAQTYLSLPACMLEGKAWRIVMVDSESTLRIAEQELLSLLPPTATASGGDLCTYRFVGVDSEWRAVMGWPKKKKGSGSLSNRSPGAGASILQIAVAESVFIFDLHCLGRVSNNGNCDRSQLCSHATRVLAELFSRPDIVKVGWDFSGKDIEKLRCSGGSTGNLRPAFTTINSLLDLNVMFEAAMRHEASTSTECRILKPLGKGISPSLTHCCQYYLHKPLYKEEQVSNWDARPLSDGQLHYAALDSHSLLALLDALSLAMDDGVVTGVLDMYLQSTNDADSAQRLRKGKGDPVSEPAWKAFTHDRNAHGYGGTGDRGTASCAPSITEKSVARNTSIRKNQKSNKHKQHSAHL